MDIVVAMATIIRPDNQYHIHQMRRNNMNKNNEQVKKQKKDKDSEDSIQVLTKEDLEGVAGGGRPGKHKPPH